VDHLQADSWDGFAMVLIRIDRRPKIRFLDPQELTAGIAFRVRRSILLI
jgi:hypothetical protein